MSLIYVGVEYGQRRSHSAFCVATSDFRQVNGRGERHFVVRSLERLSVGTTIPRLGDRLAEVEANARKQIHGATFAVNVNATGTGEPLIDHFKTKIRSRIRPVYFTHGDQRNEDYETVKLGKMNLVSRLQVLLQTGRLHLPKSPGTEILAKELLDYEIDIEPDANDHYGSFAVGSQDDLVMALGLAVQSDDPPKGRRTFDQENIPAW